MQWPGQSPELNPTEFHLLKAKHAKNKQELNTAEGKT